MGKKGFLKNNIVSDGVQTLDRIEGRAGADTIRLWEGFREQAYLWRALTLLQFPITLIALAAMLTMYVTADTIIEVPQQPLPGHYSVKQLNNDIFVNVATEVVNNIATYQPRVAARQFDHARRFLWEPALSEFEETMMKKELKTIQQTHRSQLFFINESLVRVERYPNRDFVIVRLPGTRMKLIGNKPLPADELAYYVKMTTIPKNRQNEYGIVVTDIRLMQVSAVALRSQDVKQASRGLR